VEEFRVFYETHLATQAHSAQTRTRFHEAHVDPQWPTCSQSSPRQRALEADHLVSFARIIGNQNRVALNRASRLRKSSGFQQVRQQGRSITSRLLILAWTSNDVAQLRVGFVVSKRISKRAVDRNYLKRLFGEAIRPLLPDLAPGWDIVLSARRDALTADLHTLEQDIPALLRRARLLAPAKQQEMKS